ncbi:MAG: F0F1 ATP synthase subunit B [Campylobacteraceae bacterium]|nr:F0F1 ATP synthase subunit B [Campylobacteraceae bacterium]
MKALLLFLPLLAFGAKDGAPDYDIVARTFNFVIFAGILYYFIKNPIKNAYKGRIEAIEKKMTQSRNKILEAQRKEEEARAKAEKMKVQAAEFIENGKVEAKLLKEKIERDAEAAIKILNESFAEQKEFARRDSVRKTVASVLDNAFSDKDIAVSEQALVDIIKKKVS